MANNNMHISTYASSGQLPPVSSWINMGSYKPRKEDVAGYYNMGGVRYETRMPMEVPVAPQMQLPTQFFHIEVDRDYYAKLYSHN